MKKNLLAVALFAATAVTSFAHAAAGTVNFTGSITDTMCIVDTDSQNQIVPLGNVDKSEFVAAGDTAAAKDFTLVLKDCPANATGATVRFDGTQVPGNDAVLALTTANDMATGVGIQLTDNNNKVINLHTDSTVYPLVEGTNTLNFVAKYYAIADSVTAGSANSLANFSIVYQ